MVDKGAALNLYPLRSPCKHCGSGHGDIEQRNGQACVFCAQCDAFQYNAPKHEQGLAPEPVRSNGIKPSLRYDVANRANFRCEFCGVTAEEQAMHVGHLLSEKDVREARLPLKLADDPVNLAWLCDACNLGMGSRSLSLHQLLIFALRRHLDEQDGS